MLRKIRKAGNIKGWFTNHPWLKLISLVLAILLWIYIGSELRIFLL